MKFIQQISTNKIVFRESPHRIDSKVLGNASMSTGIPLADLQVADKPFSEEQYAEAIQNQRPYDERRKQEYPTIAELVVALYDTQDRAEIDQRRADVKKKYPKE